jgi:hypothetical protein
MKTISSSIEWQRYRGPDFPLARTFRNAAVGTLAALPAGASAVDAGPALFLYRTSLELHLKALILESGANLLDAAPDRYSIFKSRSVSWLTQIVTQMLNAAGFEEHPDFKALAEEWNRSGLVDTGVRLPADNENGMGRLRGLVERTESLLDFLDRFARVLEGNSVVAINRAPRR